LLQAAAYEIVTERTIVTNIETLLAEDRTGFSESFQIELSERMKKLEIGVEVVNVVLESIHPPVEVADIYQQMATAEIQAEQMITEAEWGALLAETAAEQQKRALISIANTTHHQKIAAAVGADMEFKALVAAYQAYPDAFTFYKFTEALTQAYKKGVLIIVGEGVDSGALVIGDLSRPILEDPYYLDPEVEEEYFE
jgi:regulator of protease activity HflC (stomatin/prohibitin superfamily)